LFLKIYNGFQKFEFLHKVFNGFQKFKFLYVKIHNVSSKIWILVKDFWICLLSKIQTGQYEEQMTKSRLKLESEKWKERKEEDSKKYTCIKINNKIKEEKVQWDYKHITKIQL